MKNYKIPSGHVSISISKENGFEYAQVVYSDFVFFLSRSDIIGKSVSELWTENIGIIEKVRENQKTLALIVNSVLANDDKVYMPIDLINVLNQLDPEIVELCKLPVVKCEKSYNTTKMDFKLIPDGHVSFFFDKDSGLKSLQAKYDDGYIFSLNRDQLIEKEIPKINREIGISLERTEENRKTLANIMSFIFEENSKNDANELLNSLLRNDPAICKICDITKANYN